MTIKIEAVSSCCGSKALILQIDKPVQRLHLQQLRQLGYQISEYYEKAGVLYLSEGSLIFRGAFGTCRFQINCNGADCSEKIEKLKNILAEIIK